MYYILSDLHIAALKNKIKRITNAMQVTENSTLR